MVCTSPYVKVLSPPEDDALTLRTLATVSAPSAVDVWLEGTDHQLFSLSLPALRNQRPLDREAKSNYAFKACASSVPRARATTQTRSCTSIRIALSPFQRSSSATHRAPSELRTITP